MNAITITTPDREHFLFRHYLNFVKSSNIKWSISFLVSDSVIGKNKRIDLCRYLECFHLQLEAWLKLKSEELQLH
jgi:hypothetical protein